MRSDRSGLAARGERFLPPRSLREEVGRGIEKQADANATTKALLPRLPLLLTLSLCVCRNRARFARTAPH